MPDFITLSCPNCGGKLQITPDVERFACTYCGKEHLVNRGNGIVTLKPVIEKIEQVKESVDRGAHASERVSAELALQRIEKEKQVLLQQSKKTQPEIAWASGLLLIAVMPFVLLTSMLLSSNAALKFVGILASCVFTTSLIVAAIWLWDKGHKKKTAIENKLRALEIERLGNLNTLWTR